MDWGRDQFKILDERDEHDSETIQIYSVLDGYTDEVFIPVDSHGIYGPTISVLNNEFFYVARILKKHYPRYTPYARMNFPLGIAKEVSREWKSAAHQVRKCNHKILRKVLYLPYLQHDFLDLRGCHQLSVYLLALSDFIDTNIDHSVRFEIYGV